jgi:hypothetical protein
MRLLIHANAWSVVCLFAVSDVSLGQDAVENSWDVAAPILSQGPEGSFDEVAVKDPSIVFHGEKWHLFYTARSRTEYTTGYVSARTLTGLRSAPRHELKTVRGKSRYGCAPQVFYFEPQRKWYLVFQNRDSNYQPAFSTTATISRPDTWSVPLPLIRKDQAAKWIDFWVICDETRAYLFYTQGHHGVIVRSTSLDEFPDGWGEGQEVLRDIHEAVHVYQAQCRNEYHMIYELNQGGVRSFGVATSRELTGPWTKVTDKYATGDQLSTAPGVPKWTEMVSHGEALRSGYDQRMQYDPQACRWLIQGILKKDSNVPYPSLPWQLGIMSQVDTRSPGRDGDEG